MRRMISLATAFVVTLVAGVVWTPAVSPALASSPVPLAQITAGEDFSVGITAEGVAYAWGANAGGQLGDGTRDDSSEPVRTVLPDGVELVQVVAGDDFTIGLASDGVAYAWGVNGSGQRGDGSGKESLSVVRVAVPQGVVFSQVAAGDGFAVGLTSEGQAYAWGANAAGQLGDGSRVDRLLPVAVALPEGVALVQIAAGEGFVVGVTADGGAYAWGANSAGQLGDGSTDDRLAPVAVALPEGVVLSRVSAGSDFAVGVTADGGAYAWGANSAGQLGDGSTDARSVPVAVALPEGVVLSRVSAGSDFAVGVTADGAAYAWGENSAGQLGDGSLVRRLTPVVVEVPDGVVLGQVAAGADFGMAVTRDGVVYAWGENSAGQLGDGSTTDRRRPVVVVFDEGAVVTPEEAPESPSTQPSETPTIEPTESSEPTATPSVSPEPEPIDSEQVDPAIDIDDLMRSLEPLDAPLLMAQALPADAPGYFTDVSANFYSMVAADINGDVFAWGSGLLGDGTDTVQTSPVLVQMPAGEDVVQVSAGESYFLALTSAGEVYAWGQNGSGRLGLGDTTNRSTPQRVVFPAGVTITQVSGGHASSYALASDGTVYAWGGNAVGQLGDGTTTQRSLPVVVSRGAIPEGVTVTQVAGGDNNGFALGSNGRVYAWGAGEDGQLGNGSTGNALVPVAVSLGAMPSTVTVTQLPEATLPSHMVVLGSDGFAYSWGLNDRGQLGDGTTTNRLVPTKVVAGSVPTGVALTQVGAGWLSSFAVGSNGLTYGWGENSFGQLGISGNTTDQSSPQAMSQGALPVGVSPAKISGGYENTAVLGADGYVYTTGNGGYGQLGRGSTANSTVLVATSRVPASASPSRQQLVVAVGDAVTPSEALTSHGLYGVVSYSVSPALQSGLSFNSATGVISGTPAADAVPTVYTITGVGTRANTTTTSSTVSVTVSNGYFTDVSPGSGHTVAVDINGDVFAWGVNSYGQLGDGSTTTRLSPVLVQMPAGVDVTQVAAGAYHSLTLTSAGEVYAWGRNNAGQLGVGTTVDSSVPVRVSLPAGVTITRVAAGFYFSYALASDGTVYAWGDNTYGQLGDGTTTNRSLPVVVSRGVIPVGVTITEVQAGEMTGYVLGSNGKLYAWGLNSSGQLGNASTTNSSTPVAVSAGVMPVGVTVADFAVRRGYHVVVAGSNGVLYAWGYNTNGQVGDGSTTDRTSPVKVSAGVIPAGVTFGRVGAGSSSSYAVGSNGVTYAWGAGGNGQLGTGSASSATTPVAMLAGAAPAGVTPVVVAGGSDFSVMLGTNGFVYTVGLGGSGQLGRGSTANSTSWVAASRVPGSAVPSPQHLVVAVGDAVTPSEVLTSHGLYGVVSYSVSPALQSGLSFNSATGVISGTPAADAVPTVYTITGAGTRANTTSSSSTVSVTVSNGYFTDVATGTSHTVAVDINGDVFAWGVNSSGQVGDRSTTDRLSPVLVQMPVGVDVTQVAAGMYHSLAVTSTGDVYAWGAGSNDQLGVGTTASSSVPVRVPLPAGVTITQVAAGAYWSYALASDGTVYAWGQNYNGQLGDGTTTQRSLPVVMSRGAIPVGVTITEVQGSGASGYVLGSNGKLYAWGYNGSGELGNGSTTNSSTPVAVSAGVMPAGVTVADFATHLGQQVVVAGSDGVLYAWGYNGNAQVGDGTATNRTLPVKVSAGVIPAGVTFDRVGVGSGSSYAVGSNGVTYAWGMGGNGQLGAGSTSNSNTPAAMLTGGAPVGVTPVAVTGGGSFGVMLGTDGFVYTVGLGGSGQLGRGTTADSSAWVAPSRVPGAVLPGSQFLSTVIGVAGASEPIRTAGLYGTVTVSRSGSMPAGWSFNSTTGVISGTSTAASASATSTFTATGTRVNTATGSGTVQVQVGDGYFTDVATGFSSTVAVDINGDVFAWGRNNLGQLGDGSTTDRLSPVLVQIPAGEDITQVSAGDTHVLALTSAGAVYAWGSNGSGRLGVGTTVDSSVPVRVSFPAGVTITQVSAGEVSSYALAADGTMYAWGHGASGALGNGGTANALTPVVVSRGAIPVGVTVTQIAAGNLNGYALGSNGRVYTWGEGQYGELGNGSTADALVPVAVSLGAMPSTVTVAQMSEATLSYHMVVLGSDGFAYAWGYNAQSQLGDGTTTQRSVPVRVLAGAMPAGVTVTHVDVARFSSFGVGSNGVTYGWGSNGNGELGISGNTTNQTSPQAMSQGALPAGVIPATITGGAAHTAVLGGDGYIYSTGSGQYGQLGRGTTANTTVLVATSRVPGSASPSSQGVVAAMGVAVTPSEALTGHGLYGVVSYSVSPALQSGLSFNSATGVISGTPAEDAVSAVYTITGVGTRANTTTSSSTVSVTVSNGYFTDVAAGALHSVAVDINGDVFAWGTNTNGQVGDRSTTTRTSPVLVQMPAGVDVTQVAAGQYHSLAVTSTGEVYAWGDGSNGQLGVGTTVGLSVPVRVSLPAGVTITQVSAAAYSSYALASDGTVYAWGQNNLGQLGDGSTTQRLLPVVVSRGAIPAGVTITEVQGGAASGYALGSNGKLYAWGYNGSGQLGNASTANSSIPVAVSAGVMPAGVTVADFAANLSEHVVVAGSDGVVYAWGLNSNSQVGDGSTTTRTSPVKVSQGVIPAGVTFDQVGASILSSYAVGSNGVTYAWGLGTSGQLGTGATSSASTPVAMVAGAVPLGVTPVVVSGGSAFAVMLGTDGFVYSVGAGDAGQLGRGTTANSSVLVAASRVPGSALPSPQQLVAGVGDAVASEALTGHGLYGVVSYSVSPALQSGLSFNSATGVISGTPAEDAVSTVYTITGVGTRANTTSSSSTVSVTVSNGYFTEVSAGSHHSVALDINGDVFAWGEGDSGRLGDRSTTDSLSPVLVQMPAGVDVIQVAAGGYHSLAVTSTGEVYAWGYNVSGQLGVGTTVYSSVPVRLSFPAGVTITQVAGGLFSSYALASDGTVYAWGSNVEGQLGDGSTTQRLLPVVVSRGAIPVGVTVTQIAGGRTSAYALGSDGKLYAWGDNGSGQLGNGSTGDQTTPVAVSAGAMPAGVTVADFAAHLGDQVIVAGSDGVLYAWGYNVNGQLGDGSTTTRTSPVKVSQGVIPAGVTFDQVGAGEWSSYAVGSNGVTYAWGFGLRGQLGTGVTSSASTPVAMVAGGVPVGVTPVVVSGGLQFAVMLGTDGFVYSVGAGDVGQLGRGSTADSSTWVLPGRVPASVLPGSQFLSTVIGVPGASEPVRTTGLYGTVTVVRSGSMPAGWSYNSATGVISGTSTAASASATSTFTATGTRVNTATGSGTVQVQVGDGYFTDVATGFSSTVAVDINGDVFAWGRNNLGQLGDGSTTDRLSPVLVQIPAGEDITQVSAGDTHVLALTSAGAVYAWGSNGSGRLGVGTTVDSSVPVRVSFPAGVTITQVSAGEVSSYALAADGTMYAWGHGASGALGNGGTANASTPVVVSRGAIPVGVTVTQIAAGNLNGYALGSNGRVYTWGEGQYGELGNGSTGNALVPVAVSLGAMPSTVTVTQLPEATLSWHMVVLGSDGFAYAWGRNASGQLGDGTTTDRSVPTRVVAGAMPAGVALTQVGVGRWSSFGVGSDGVTYAWGQNTNGQLGISGNTTNQPSPVAMSQGALPGGVLPATITGGYAHTAVLGSDGYIYSTGSAAYGQLGRGSTASSTALVSTSRVPVTLSPATQTVETEVGLGVVTSDYETTGLYGAMSYTAAAALPIGLSLKTSTGVISGVALSAADGVTVGLTAAGSRANTVSAAASVAFVVEGIGSFVSAGGDFAVALGTDGVADAWGWGSWGQLGDGSGASSSTAVPVAAGVMPQGVVLVQVSSGLSHSVALGSDGVAYAWGANEFGQLGDGSTVGAVDPVQVQVPAGVSFVMVAAGGLGSVSLGSDGNVYSWGWNNAGRLGDGSDVNSSVPVAVSRGAIPVDVSVIGLAVGVDQTVVLGSDGRAYAWGYGRSGQLGDGLGASSSVPVAVSMPAGVEFTRVAVGTDHAVALASDGRVFAWGGNSSGQLGDGSLVDRLVPVEVERGGIPVGVNVVGVAAGESVSALVGDDGRVYSFGANGSGQLGNGSTVGATAPVAVSDFGGSTAVAVEVGDRFMIAQTASGEVFAWGSGAAGRLGSGATADQLTPGLVTIP